MGTLRYPSPASYRTAHGMTVHTWAHESPVADPVLLVHGFASNTLFNWVKTGWLDPLAATGRTVVAVDLPGHGASKDVDPAGLRVADLLSDLHDVVERAGGRAALHGYSLGSRIAWEFSHRHPQLVESLVMGGAPATDRVDDVDQDQARTWAAGGPEPSDEATRSLITVAAALPGQNLPHVVELRLSLAADAYEPAATVPTVPTLVVAGTRDEIAADSPELVSLVRRSGADAQLVELPGRSHVNALTAQPYKSAVVEFLGG